MAISLFSVLFFSVLLAIVLIDVYCCGFVCFALVFVLVFVYVVCVLVCFGGSGACMAMSSVFSKLKWKHGINVGASSSCSVEEVTVQ